MDMTRLFSFASILIIHLYIKSTHNSLRDINSDFLEDFRFFFLNSTHCTGYNFDISSILRWCPVMKPTSYRQQMNDYHLKWWYGFAVTIEYLFEMKANFKPEETAFELPTALLILLICFRISFIMAICSGVTAAAAAIVAMASLLLIFSFCGL